MKNFLKFIKRLITSIFPTLNDVFFFLLHHPPTVTSSPHRTSSPGHQRYFSRQREIDHTIAKDDNLLKAACGTQNERRAARLPVLDPTQREELFTHLQSPPFTPSPPPSSSLPLHPSLPPLPRRLQKLTLKNEGHVFADSLEPMRSHNSQ